MYLPFLEMDLWLRKGFWRYVMNASPPNSRKSPRRPPRGATKVVCRKGTLGLGPNLGVRLLDVSEGGVRLLVKTELVKGDGVEVVLVPPAGGKDVVRRGEVVVDAGRVSPETGPGIEATVGNVEVAK